MRAELVILSDGNLRIVVKSDSVNEDNAIGAFASGLRFGSYGFDGTRPFLAIDLHRDKL